MPRRGSGHLTVPAQLCPDCGFVLPPAKSWTSFTKADHDYHHLQAAHIKRTVQGVGDTRTDVEDLARAAGVYVGELERYCRQLRALADDQWERIEELEGELDAAVGRHPAGGVS